MIRKKSTPLASTDMIMVGSIPETWGKGPQYLSGHKSIDVAESFGFKLKTSETERHGDVAIHSFKKGRWQLDLFTYGPEPGAQRRVGRNVEWFLVDKNDNETSGIGTRSLRKALKELP